MTINRRQFIQGTVLPALSWALLGLNKSFADGNDNIIKVATIFDLSGGLDLYGRPASFAANLAADEINAAGGLLGKKIKMINYDAQSSMQLYTQYAQQAALKDKVSVVHAGITSASREVIRPVFDRFKTLYFYPALYEGGVCDRNYFSTGATPAQTVEKLAPYAINKWGRKVFILAADYNYGHIISEWVKKYVKDNNGETVAVEFFPLDVTDFGAAISKIQAAKPDFIWSALVGGAHLSFYRQWYAAGMTGKIPIASNNFGSGGEHVILSPEEANGMLVCSNYFPEIDTPANNAFISNFKRKYGNNSPYVGDIAVGAYQAIKLWAEGVKLAGSVERMDVIKALEKGVSIQTPSGQLKIDGITHHSVLDVHIAAVENHKMKILTSFTQQPPLDTAMFCNLEKNPNDTKQYEVKI